jgi:hypothetical protein
VSTANVETKSKTAIVHETELAPVFIDLGKKKKKAVKQLRNGKGKLVEQIQGTLADLKAAGTISMAAQPVIVVVREKRRKKGVLGVLGG